MDFCGPMKRDSLHGSLYFMLLVDDFSRLSWVFFLRKKSEPFPNFTKWLALIQNESRQTLKTLYDSKGGEFASNAMAKFYSQHGIWQEFANTDTSPERCSGEEELDGHRDGENYDSPLIGS